MDSTRSEYARHLEYIEEIESAAHVTALSTRLPWLLLRLREVGYQAVSRALIDGGQHTSGQERPDYVKDRIRQEIRRAAGKLISADAQPEDIVCALGTFTTKEWETLIAGFGSDDLDLLRQYLDAHKGFLESDLGRRKYLLIYGDAIK